MSRPSVTQLKRALVISEQIQKLEAELASILGNAGAAKTTTVAANKAPARKKRKKSKISPEGLANIIAAQKKRWAKQKKAEKK